MKVKDLIALLEADGWLQVRMKGPGCVAVGDTKEEVLAFIREAIELHLEGLKEGGEPIPHPSSTSALVEIEAV